MGGREQRRVSVTAVGERLAVDVYARDPTYGVWIVSGAFLVEDPADPRAVGAAIRRGLNASNVAPWRPGIRAEGMTSAHTPQALGFGDDIERAEKAMIRAGARHVSVRSEGSVIRLKATRVERWGFAAISRDPQTQVPADAPAQDLARAFAETLACCEGLMP